MVEYSAATVAVRDSEAGRFLLVKRAETKDMDPGMWEFPGGGINEDEDPLEAARRELEEETGLEEEMIRSGEPGVVETRHGLLKVYPFLAETDEKEIELSGEHEDYRWIEKEDLDSFETVPGLKLELEALGL